jgi:hypothetical protein
MGVRLQARIVPCQRIPVTLSVALRCLGRSAMFLLNPCLQLRHLCLQSRGSGLQFKSLLFKYGASTLSPAYGELPRPFGLLSCRQRGLSKLHEL